VRFWGTKLCFNM